jgi:peptidoglycan/LPS O-acetylase OafA/YrhL
LELKSACSEMSQHNPHLSHLKYRPDLDGLRAVAVLSVVGYHAFPHWVKGGFIGVDVFFVISGFLISGIIYENLDRGTFTFREFYARRIRRIFPALILVMAASYAFGWFSLFADEFAQLGKHMAGGAAFISNFILWQEAGYFDTSAETKPLLHLWSLGIEEQFYIIWPLLLWRAWKRKFSFVAVTLAIAAGSLYLNLDGIKHDAEATFYSPLTRFWELMCGSLLAWVAIYKKSSYANFKLAADRILASAIYRNKTVEEGRTLANLLAFVGLALLAWGSESIAKDYSFPGGWALVPVVAAVLIISAGPQAWANRHLLSNRVAIWFGLISYPLYLWHWPLLSFAHIVESGTPSTYLQIAAVAASILLAWLSYRLIERPVRLGKNGTAKVSALVVLMAVIGYVGYNTYDRDGLSFRSALLDASPPIKRLSEDNSRQHSICLNAYGLSRQKIRYCRLSGNPKPHIALIGDSHAATLFSGLSKKLLSTDHAGLLMIGGRLFIDVAVYPEGSDSEIAVYKGGIAATNFVANEKSIDTVIMVSRGPGYLNGTANFYLLSDPRITDKRKVFEIGMRKTLDLLTKNGKKIIFVLDNPDIDFDPRICQDARPLQFGVKHFDCVIPRSAFDNEQRSYRELVFTVLRDYPAVRIFDQAAYLCDRSFCRAKVGSRVLYGDDDHFSEAGSDFIADKLINVINGASSKVLEAN